VDSRYCTACPTTTGLNYDAIPAIYTFGPCVMTATNNAQLLINIDKNTSLQTDYLKSVQYNLLSQVASGLLLNQFLYKQNVI